MARHAHESAVDVVLSALEGNVVLVVSDDGRGMDQRAPGAGWTTCGPARTATAAT